MTALRRRTSARRLDGTTAKKLDDLRRSIKRSRTGRSFVYRESELSYEITISNHELPERSEHLVGVYDSRVTVEMLRLDFYNEEPEVAAYVGRSDESISRIAKCGGEAA